MHCCKRVWTLPYTHLRRSSSIAANSSTVVCLSSWIVTIRPPEHTVFQEPPQDEIWYSEVGWPSGPSDVAETSNTGNTLLHVPTLHCNWPYEMASSPLPFPFPPPPRQAIAPAQYSNLKCVIRLRASLYIYIYIYIYMNVCIKFIL